jgi:DNA-binding IclR family transcriptional regulator
MISAVSRAMAILEELSAQPNGVTVSELVMGLQIEKSVVSRVLATLESDGYVIRDAVTDSFRLGLKLAGIALRHIDSTGVTDMCIPLLRDVADKTGELIQLAIVQNDQMLYVAKAEGHQRIRVLSLVGRPAVLHTSVAGKVWLASLPENRALTLALKNGLERYTENTITNVDDFRAELMRVRKKGYATVQEEMIEGAAAIGVPITDRRGGRVLGAVVLSGPAYRLPLKRLESMVPMLKGLAQKLTDLGNIDIHFGGEKEADIVLGAPAKVVNMAGGKRPVGE